MQPLGVYIHWPYCARICPYCDFNVVRDRRRADEQAALVDAIADDLRGHAVRTGARRLVSIFFGGGTPSLMDPQACGRLIALCRSLWPSADDLEVTLEANPTDAEADRFRAFAEAGVNRLSLGVQALDDEALRFLGRNHDAAAAIRAIEIATSAVPRLSLDVIYALPGQTAPAWTEALERVCAFEPEHISAYQLSIEPGAAFQRAVRRGRLQPADPDLAADLYDATQTVLERRGYDAYEVSNHAKGSAARSRHNLVYWRGDNYVGVGPGAHGRLGSDARTLSDRLATEAEPRIADYIRRVAETGLGWRQAEAQDPLTRMEERVLMGLRIDEGVPLSEAQGLDLAPAGPLIAAGLLRIRGERLQATAAGRLVLDRLTAELLA